MNTKTFDLKMFSEKVRLTNDEMEALQMQRELFGYYDSLEKNEQHVFKKQIDDLLGDFLTETRHKLALLESSE
jgi:hypothetical protein